MSAWLLNKYEIDVLVHWLHKTGVSRQQPDSLGAMLWSDNYCSIRYRYGNYDRDGKYLKRPSYTYRTPKARHYFNGKFFDPEDMDQALKMCNFYDYQTCEFPAYEQSRSYKMIHKLMNVLENMGADWSHENLHWGEPYGGYTEESLQSA